MPRSILLFMFIFSVALTARAAPGESVILLHGLGRTRWSLYRVEQVLRASGYTVINLTYPSREQSIETLATDYLGPLIAAQGSATHLHFVTHSMGGIILRCYLQNNRVPNMGRVVMLAPPNAGSELADFLKSNWFYRTVNGPAGQQLGLAGLPTTLGAWPVGSGELGIIAGDVSLNPLFSATLPGPNDGKVTVESARLAGAKDFSIVHSSHTWLAWRSTVLEQIQTFLHAGHFTHSTASPTP